MTLYEGILRLTEYGIKNGLIEEEDRVYIINRFLEIFGVDEFEEVKITGDCKLAEILNSLTDVALSMGLLENDGITQRDLFDTKLMGVLTPLPSSVIKEFWTLYKNDPKLATDFFYKLSQDTNYIRRDRVKKDKKWKVKSRYGDIEISINLSKPEKDPKAIALAGKTKSAGYPKCQLCIENEGYRGRNNHPARQNHRIIPIIIQNTDWGLQYSPYVYYNEHCIVLNSNHTPMKIERATFEKLLDFIEQFPHYFLGSNADLPIVGGSILSHDHFQGGNHTFPMEIAEIEKRYIVPGFEDVDVGILNWPLSVIRLRSKNRESIINLSEHVLNIWRNYTDEDAYIFAETDGEKHNTITPIARMKDGCYEIDLTLRNNIITEECPLGLYHPHNERHHIKKENIGLIEVMGLAILPARLDKEMALLSECLVGKKNIDDFEELSKHKKWSEMLKKECEITEENVNEIIEKEIGKVFIGVLEDAGVYKCTIEGRRDFERFIKSL